MPRITDDDDVNLDDVETDPPEEENDSEGADETEQDATDEEAPDDSETDSEEPSERDEPDVAARGRQQERQPERRSRASDRVRTLNEQLQREREDRLALQRRFDEFATRQTAQPRESEDQRNQRRALLSDSERAAEDIRDSEARINARLNQTTFAIQDNADKSLFEAKTVNNASYRRMQGEVETEHARLAAAGQFVSRQAIYYYLLGKKIDDSRGSKINETRRAQGGRRVERQTVRAGDTRNDTTQSRRSGTKSLEDRLADVPL